MKEEDSMRTDLVAIMINGHLVGPERWRVIDGVDGYEVSDHGRVRSWRGGGPRSHILATFNCNGYPFVTLRQRPGKRRLKSYGVHKLVLAAFDGPAPAGMQCAHNNGDRSNPRLWNLRWATPKENAGDQIKHGTQVRGSRHGAAVFSESTVRHIKARLKSGEKVYRLKKEYGVSKCAIVSIRDGKTWRHVAESSRYEGGTL